MEKILCALGLIGILTGCEALTSPNDGIPRIRSQADVNAYNATVTAASID